MTNTNNAGKSYTKDYEVQLIEGTLECITVYKIPSNQQIFHPFFHLHSSEKKRIQSNAIITAKKACAFWEKF